MLSLARYQSELIGGGRKPSSVVEDLRDVLDGSPTPSATPSWGDYLCQAEKELSETLSRGPELTSGLRELDAIHTFRRKNVHVVAAPTSHGKTAFSLRMANRAVDAGLTVAYWCFEDWSSIPYKVISQRFGVPLEWYTKYHLTSKEERVKADSFMALGKTISGLHVIPEMPYGSFRAEVKRIRPDVVVCDYIQRYAESYGASESKREACGKLASDFDSLVKEFNAYGILCSQVRRRENKEGGSGPRRPTLYDLKESGDIENYASSVLMLYWPWKDALDKQRLDKKDYLIMVEKDKLGQCGETHVIFDGETQNHRDKYELT